MDEFGFRDFVIPRACYYVDNSILPLFVATSYIVTVVDYNADCGWPDNVGVYRKWSVGSRGGTVSTLPLPTINSVLSCVRATAT